MKIILSKSDLGDDLYNVYDLQTLCAFAMRKVDMYNEEIYGVSDDEITMYGSLQAFAESLAVTQRIVDGYDWHISVQKTQSGKEFLVCSVSPLFFMGNTKQMIDGYGVFRYPSFLNYWGSSGMLPNPDKSAGFTVFDGSSVTVPFMPMGSFYGDKYVREIYTPYLKAIPENFARSCAKLEKVVIHITSDEQEMQLGYQESMKTHYIGLFAFNGCAALQSVEIDDNIRLIDRDAFTNCTQLSDLRLPACLTVIERDAFRNCCSLREIVMPDGMQKIMDSAFRYCVRLTSVTLNEGLTSIGEYAFSGTGITSVDIPQSVETMSDMAFSDGTEVIVHTDELYAQLTQECRMAKYRLRRV